MKKKEKKSGGCHAKSQSITLYFRLSILSGDEISTYFLLAHVYNFF